MTNFFFRILSLKIEPGPKVVYEAVKYLMDNSYTTGTVVPLNGGRNLIQKEYWVKFIEKEI